MTRSFPPNRHSSPYENLQQGCCEFLLSTRLRIKGQLDLFSSLNLEQLPISNDLLPSLPFLKTMTSSSYSSCLPHSLPLEVIEKIFLLAFTPSTPLTINSSSITPPPSSHNFRLSIHPVLLPPSLLPLHYHPPSSRLGLFLRSKSRTLRRWRTGSSWSLSSSKPTLPVVQTTRWLTKTTSISTLSPSPHVPLDSLSSSSSMQHFPPTRIPRTKKKPTRRRPRRTTRPPSENRRVQAWSLSLEGWVAPT